MSPRNEKILLGVAFLFCLAIRTAFLDQKNLWFDEVFSWHISMSSFYEIIVRTTNDIHPPLYYFILKIWNFCFGDSMFAMRMLSALSTSIAVFLIYPISKRLFSSFWVFVPVILYALSPLNLFYSQEVRMAGINLTLNLAAIYLLIRLLEDENIFKKYYKSAIFYLYILSESAALYTHYFSFFILAAQIIFLSIHFRKRLRELKPFVFSYLAIGLIYVPWIPALIEHAKRGQAWRQKQGLPEVLNELLNLLKDSSMGLYYHYTNLEFVKILTWILAVITLLIVILVFLRSRNEQVVNYGLLIGLALFVPLVLAAIISFNQRIEYYRYLSILVPYMCIALLMQLNKIKHKQAVYAIVLLFAVINSLGIYWHFSNDFKNDDYRMIIKDINRSYTQGDRIYVQPHYCGWIIDYTKKQDNLPIPKFVDHRYGFDVLLDSLHTQNPSHFWLVMDYSAVDTSLYKSYISQVQSAYKQTFLRSYPMAPARVEVYRFEK